MKLETLSGLEIGQLVNQKQIRPQEVVEYFAKRIEERNPSLHAFTYTKIEDAMEEAKRVEKLVQQKYHVPFAGVPVGLKDFLDSKKGWTNSHGGVRALVREDVADSQFYAAARRLGAIAIGKTNAPAFGFSGACQNEMYGQTCNPFDVTRTSGGSSGGSGAAVADGLIPFAEGGDAGGSIRIPAAWGNLFGMKPSLGTVPSYCRPDGWTATHPYCFNGCLTKTVEDSATMLTAMAIYDPRDPISLPINSDKNFVHLMNRSIKGMKIAVTFDFNLYPAVDDEIRDAIDDLAHLLEYAGAKVDYYSNFTWKHTLDEIMRCWAWSISVDTAVDLKEWKDSGLDLVKDHKEQLPEEFIKYNEIASKATIWDMKTFNNIRTDILDQFENIFEDYDLIISPTTICKPMKNEWQGRCKQVGDHILDEETNFIAFGETPLANFVGYPAASVPAGLTSDNLPIGMQVIARQYKDEDVLAVARTVEKLRPWRDNYKLAFDRL